jgi:hypothetical protein
MIEMGAVHLAQRDGNVPGTLAAGNAPGERARAAFPCSVSFASTVGCMCSLSHAAIASAFNCLQGVRKSAWPVASFALSARSGR